MQSTLEMQSTPDIKPADPPAVDPGRSTQGSGLSAPDKELVARADERLAHAYEQIALADEQLARINQQMSRLGPEAGHQLDRRSFRHRSALRGLIGLLLAACIFSAAFASQFASDATQQMISRWAPQAVSAAVLPNEETQPSIQPAAPFVRLAAADATLSQAPPAAQTTPQEMVPTAAAIPAELTQLIETMSHDLASVLQKIDELKASQDQLARDQATITEQVKANQEQVARLVATAAEQHQRAATLTPLPRPVTAPARTPTPPTQARVQREPPVQLRPPLR
ncbi:hypothetical protein QA649_13790 [Bradyrhizobium sp. CB1717]|uniref:hypothetical protein n=1 Tax=Bradyrhizobium sp. CB1717 TaxID=3039154 RepID=UPI0024B06C12|nr:hypothetical protein [Bradyrhizobium sp. CB1717]WFU27234.1 hypothetical protein QA649_13790 [Bradyrhizobium sp. CB1717]